MLLRLAFVLGDKTRQPSTATSQDALEASSSAKGNQGYALAFVSDVVCPAIAATRPSI